MIIHQVNEENYMAERKAGELVVNEKFRKLDALEGLPEGELKIQLAEQFRDPTVWAYGTLFDKQGNKLKLKYYQDRIINDRHRFVHVTASNQIGKTVSVCVKAAHHALFVQNASVMIISKSEQQAIYVLDEIKWFLKRSRIPYTEMIGDIENRMELHLIGPENSNSAIRCFPPTTSALGYPATLLIGDEIGFWEKVGQLSQIDYYDQVLEPRTNQTKSWKHPFLKMGQIIFITNPNGQNGLAWRCFSSDFRFHNYVYCWLADPINNYFDYEEAKNRLPLYRFASIYSADYVTTSGGFITPQQYEHFASFGYHPNSTGEVLFLGGDFAGEDVRSRGRDFNVIFGAVVQEDKTVRIVYVREWPAGTKKAEIYEEIKRLASTFTIGKFCYDKVGVGDKIKSDLLDMNILNEYQIEPLTYSLQNKSEVFINMQRLFEKGVVHGWDIPKLREQLLALEVKMVEGSVHLKIHHRTESIKDDFCDAAANVLWAAKMLSSAPVSAQFIPFTREKPKPDQLDCKHLLRRHDKRGELFCKSCGEQL